MTRTAKHTPGPWAVEQCSAPVYGSDGSIIAEGIGIGAQSTHIGTVYGKNSSHNAHLIAAAPALYEAVQNLLEFIKGNRGAREGNPYCKAEVRQALKVLAAIQGKKDYLDADTLPQAEGA